MSFSLFHVILISVTLFSTLTNREGLYESISIDPMTGMPILGFDGTIPFSQDSTHGALDLIYSYQTKKKSIVVVFDEFQDILNLKDAGKVLAILHSKVRFHSDVSYLFSGSVRNKMMEIFSDPDSPFFKSAEEQMRRYRHGIIKQVTDPAEISSQTKNLPQESSLPGHLIFGASSYKQSALARLTSNNHET